MNYECVIYIRYICFWYILLINCIFLVLRIYVSLDIKEILDMFGMFELELRGLVEMKVRYVFLVRYWNFDINFGFFINVFYRNLLNVFINKKI